MSDSRIPDRAAIESKQLGALQTMMGSILPSNRFYVKKLQGIDTNLDGLDEFFVRVPFTFKQEVVDDQLAYPPYGTNLTYPIERYTRFSQTSGTTGTPLRWLDTNASWSWMVDNWVQVFRECGVRSGDRIFFAFSFGPFLGFWTSFEAGARLGCMCLPGGGLSSMARLRTILDNEVTVLCCTPTYAIRLGEVAAEANLDLANSQVRTLVVAGEPGACIPATRARVERLWAGAQMRDHHGMTEIGPVSFECPQRRGVLHVMEAHFIPEVIDPKTEQPVGDDETGELVLTNLGRIASPLIRYRTGDLVKRSAQAPCVCGRYDLALEGGILGRVDDMVVVRGVNLHPAAVEEIVRAFNNVVEYRVELHTERAMTELAIQVEPTPDCRDTAVLAQEIEASLRTAFNLRVPVSIAPPGSLPRFELKAKRWIRMEPGEDRA